MKITSKGQVTIPLEIRNMLKLQPNNQLIFEINQGEVRLSAPNLSLEEVYGSVVIPKHLSKHSAQQIAKILEDERAEDYKQKFLK